MFDGLIPVFAAATSTSEPFARMAAYVSSAAEPKPPAPVCLSDVFATTAIQGNLVCQIPKSSRNWVLVDEKPFALANPK